MKALPPGVRMRGETLKADVGGVGVVDLHMPVDPEDVNTPDWFREGVARRRILLGTGRCPCGATLGLGDQVAVARLRLDGHSELVVMVPTRHFGDCPASRPEINQFMSLYLSLYLVERAKAEGRNGRAS